MEKWSNDRLKTLKWSYCQPGDEVGKLPHAGGDSVARIYEFLAEIRA